MGHKITPSVIDWSIGKVKGFYGKDLFKLDKGTVKLVKIEPFATYPMHLHPDKSEYAYVIEGNPEFEIGDQQYTSKRGDFFIFPINTKHAISNRMDLECLLLIGSVKG